MSTIFGSISSNIFKKAIPLYASISINPLQIPKQKLAIPQYALQTPPLPSFRIACRAHDPTYVPGGSPPEIPTAPPTHNPGLPPEVPRRHNVPEFDPIPPEKPIQPPPTGPDPVPPKPEAPPPPGEPEVVPPHGPEITPPEPGPTQPDIPTPIMGSDGLVFY